MRQDPLFEAWRAQAAQCRRLGSPFTARLCAILAERLPEGRTAGLMAAWPGDRTVDAVPLRLLGGLHRLVRTGADPGLAACYPPHEVPEADLRAALAAAIAAHDGTLAGWLVQPPQTNEVGRSAVLLGGLQIVAASTVKALELLEIGASAGLNLLPERWGYDLGPAGRWGAANAPVTLACPWRGRRPPLRRLCIDARAGVDLAPVDPADGVARERLLSYIWPDQPGRLARTAAALDHAARHGIRVERADAAEWLEERLAEPHPKGVARVLMHSIMWQYMAAATQRRLTMAMVAAGVRTDRGRPLAWLRMEADGDAETAAVILTTWPGGRTRALGRADFHGRFVEWSGER